jgi:hypothetical protein
MEESGYIGYCDNCGGEVAIVLKDDKALVFLCSVCEERIYMEGKEQGYLEGTFDSGGLEDLYE